MLLAGANQEWNAAVKPSSCSITYKQFGLVGSFPVQWRSVGCAEGAGGCGAWLGESGGMGKGLHSQRGAVEDGQGRSLLFYGVVVRMNSLGRREPPWPAGTKSRVAHHRSSASLWCCPRWASVRSVLWSHRAAQPAEQRVERTGFKVDNRHGDREGATPPWSEGMFLGCFVEIYLV